MKNGISRRSFLSGAGAAIGGFAAGSVLGYSQPAAAAPGAWAVPAITKTNVMTNAFNSYWGGGGCCYGAAHGIIKTIRDTGSYAAEWDDIPTDITKWGAGGGFGNWGTLCGALSGAYFVMQQAIGAHGYFGYAIDTLTEWYINESFPNIADGDIQTILNAKTNYEVKDPVTSKTVFYDLSVANITGGATGNITTTVANSPLCHASVSTFLAGQKFGGPAKLQIWVPLVAGSHAATRDDIIAANASSDGCSPRVGGIEKKVRCATLTAQVAWKAVELIQAVKSSSYGSITGWVYAGDAAETCTECHTWRADHTSAEDNEQGKMPCNACHTAREDDPVIYKDNDKNTVADCSRP